MMQSSIIRSIYYPGLQFGILKIYKISDLGLKDSTKDEIKIVEESL